MWLILILLYGILSNIILLFFFGSVNIWLIVILVFDDFIVKLIWLV